MEHTIAQARSINNLILEVEAKIHEGWRPQGGMAIANASSLIFAQAMIRSTNSGTWEV